MRTITLGLFFCCLAIQSYAGLDGYSYALLKAPVGNEWESPENLALNKEQPRATFYSFQDVESARAVLPENSKYWQSLDGTWDFHWAPNPDVRPKDFYEVDFSSASWDKIQVPSSWNILGVQKDGTLKYGKPIYVNQYVIFQYKIEIDDWKKGVMREPLNSRYTTYEHRNEVGSYRRDFEIPQDWKGREVFINFEGVDSFFYLWINGQYVGFSKNSRNVAAFNITPFLRKGKNVLAVEVYRSSDGSFLEAQDMFRLPGIFRTVSLYSTPQVQIRDLVAVADLDDKYIDGSLTINADVRNLQNKKVKDYKMVYSLYANKLYSDENTLVEGAVATAEVSLVEPLQAVKAEKAVLNVRNPNKWSAEYPYRYTLVAELKDKKDRTIETVSTYVGFREVEIKDTEAKEDEFGLAGRYFYVNGKTVKFKGVNRHESNPAVGHAITRKMMEDEVMLMKRANINHVRCSHYPDNSYWYYLCDKYGIYLEDEANIESHEYFYDKESLSHPIEWEKAHVARVMEMVHSDINHPSIVIWSLGNEAGPGKNFVTAYNALKTFDKSRPVQYERNNDIVDIGSNQYPSIAWIRGAVKGTYDIKYPFHISEYAHSMGNAVGNLIDYWNAIESTNFFCGGAIWDWVDQSMYNYTPEGKRYLAYGGDFGDYPNDGQFVMNGIVFGDLEPKPQYYEVKKVYQNIGVKTIDEKSGNFEIFNKNYFKDLSNYKMVWSLYEDGVSVKTGEISLEVAPRQKKTFNIPYNYDGLSASSEYFVKIQFLLKENAPWADKGFAQAEEQLFVKKADIYQGIALSAQSGAALTLETNADFQTVKGNDFEVKFDLKEGTIYSLSYGGKKVILEGCGPKLEPFRAFANNDNWFCQSWFVNGLHNLKHRVLSSNVLKNEQMISFAFTVESQAPNAAKMVGNMNFVNSNKISIKELTERKFGEADFKFTTNQIWTVYSDGSVELQASILSSNPGLILPRLGYVMQMPSEYSNLSYYGRGPIENYNDRKTGQFVELHNSTVAKQFANYPKPQEMGNHEEVRWCALTDKEGKGVLFVAPDTMSISALPYSAMDLMMAEHPYQLPESKATYLHLDKGVTGLGGNSCGQGGPLADDCILAGKNDFGFIIRPTAEKEVTEKAKVSLSGISPIAIDRNKGGVVSISSTRDTPIFYSLNNSKKSQLYTESIPFRNGGLLTAWYKDRPDLKMSMTFSKIDKLALSVVYASSQENGQESAASLVDGDPSTFWHSMYSVTVAKHPHWVDFDIGELRKVKGFTYLPRQDGGNGMVKDYTIHISVNGKEWGEPICKGQFELNTQLQTVTFDKPVEARFIRFTVSSEQRGKDFATGAEFTVLMD